MLKTKLAVVAISMTAMSAQAIELPEVDVSGNVALTSDYRFRGLEQTDGQPAIQGGFDVEAKGFYGGVWASTVDLPGAEGSIEVDYTAGYRMNLTENIGVDVGYTWYDYPEDSGPGSNLDFGEVHTSVSGYGLEVGFGYTNDASGDAGTGKYIWADYSLPIGDFCAVNAHYGHSRVSSPDYFADGEEDYSDYSVGVSHDAVGLTFAVDYVGTTLDANDGSDKYGQEGVVFTVSKSL